MNIPYTIVLDLARTKITSSILISEDDTNSRTLDLLLMNNGIALDLSDVSYAQVKGIFANGEIIYDERAEILLDDDGNKTNTVRYTLPADATDHTGIITFTLTLVSEEAGVVRASITCPEFYVKVRPQLFSLTEVVEESQTMGTIEAAIAQAKAAQAAAEAALAAVNAIIATDPDIDEAVSTLETLMGNNETYYCTCSSQAADQLKVITCDSEINVEKGTTLFLHLPYGNIRTGYNITGLSIGGTVYPVKDTQLEEWVVPNNSELILTYDGDCWWVSNRNIASTSYKGVTQLSNSYNSSSTMMAATPAAVKSVYDMVVEDETHISNLQTGKLDVVYDTTTNVPPSEVADHIGDRFYILYNESTNGVLSEATFQGFNYWTHYGLVTSSITYDGVTYSLVGNVATDVWEESRA